MGHVKIDPKWLTAAEARKLTGITAEEYVVELLEAVKLAAKAQNTELKTNQSIYNLPYEFWSNEGYAKTPKYMQALKILKDLGYAVSYNCDIGSIAVDSYTWVSW